MSRERRAPEPQPNVSCGSEFDVGRPSRRRDRPWSAVAAATALLVRAVVELGTSGTHAADSCRVYNYYAGANDASACSESTWPQGSNNDGDVAGYYYNDNVNSGLNHLATYTYGALNRLDTAVATGNVTYSQTTGYDQYRNISCTPAGPGCGNFSYNAANNQIVGYTYGGRGNVLTNDGTNTYNWLSDGRLSSVVNGAGTTISANTFNALGQRVRDVTQTETTDEAYGAGGSLLWRYTGSSTDPNQRAFVPFNGGILAEYYSGGTLFDHGDELGSITASTLYNGTVCQERLFYPWGELWTGAGGSCGMHQTFAQLPDYDAEIDEYNTLNRHYSPMGRWMSPDPANAGADPSDPQTWDAYAYVRNSPTTNLDPDGLACVLGSDGNYYDDNSGGETCAEAFSLAQNNTPSATVTASAPAVSYVTAPLVDTGLIIEQQFQTAWQSIYSAAELGYVGFVSAFVNGNPWGLGVMALGIAGLVPEGAELEQIADQIVDHAFDEHIGEMTALGISTKSDLKDLVMETMQGAPGAEVRQLSGGRIAFWNDSKQAVVIYNPSVIDKGTVFIPTQGKYYFDVVLK